MALFEQIEKYITQNNLIAPNSSVVVGLSGGPDSVFLLHYMHHYAQGKNIKLIAAHLDHQWRTNSHADVLFCKQLTEQLGSAFISKKASELAIRPKKNGSLEEVGRILRRHFLQEVLKEYNAQAITLAHHAQDQQETFFIRLIRGTTLSGLTCMKAQDGYYVRPLLAINKQEIINYLKNNNIPYLTDPTNESPQFLRNRIRSNILPALEHIDSRFNNNFLRTLDQLQEADRYLEQLTQMTFEQIAQFQQDKWLLNVAALLRLDPFLANRVILHWLIVEKVPCTPSENIILEIRRFLGNTKSIKHAMLPGFVVMKQKGCSLIVKK